MLNALRTWKRDRRKNHKISKQFDAELQAIRSGLESFENQRNLPHTTSPLLRRNVHRLEKGLCMPERRAVFATDFIEETVRIYATLANQPGERSQELRWAGSVLASYFDAVDRSEPRIERAWYRFREFVNEGFDTSARPYRQHDLGTVLNLDTAGLPDGSAFLALCKARRSQRWFLDEPVDRSAIEQAVEAAVQAPSACNRQPFSYHLATSRELVGDIADIPLGTAGFGKDLPALMAVVGDLSMYAEARDRNLIHVDAALATMQFMLSMTAQGLGTVPINWPDIPENHARLRTLLDLAAHRVPIMLVGMGVPDPDASIAYSAKRSVREVLHDHG